MLERGKTYTMVHCGGLCRVEIENVVDGVAIASSGAFGGMGPFSMRFDARTGEGMGDYLGSNILVKETSLITTLMLSDEHVSPKEIADLIVEKGWHKPERIRAYLSLIMHNVACMDPDLDDVVRSLLKEDVYDRSLTE